MCCCVNVVKCGYQGKKSMKNTYQHFICITSKKTAVGRDGVGGWVVVDFAKQCAATCGQRRKSADVLFSIVFCYGCSGLYEIASYTRKVFHFQHYVGGSIRVLYPTSLQNFHKGYFFSHHLFSKNVLWWCCAMPYAVLKRSLTSRISVPIQFVPPTYSIFSYYHTGALWFAFEWHGILLLLLFCFLFLEKASLL